MEPRDSQARGRDPRWRGWARSSAACWLLGTAAPASDCLWLPLAARVPVRRWVSRLYPYPARSCPGAAARAPAQSREKCVWAAVAPAKALGCDSPFGARGGRGRRKDTSASSARRGGRDWLRTVGAAAPPVQLFSLCVSRCVLCPEERKENLGVSRKKEAGGWVSRISRGPESAQSRGGAAGFQLLSSVNFSGTEFLLSCASNLVAFSSHPSNPSAVAALALRAG